jgi:hypothetical protein
MELNFNGLLNNAVHVLGFGGEDGGIVELNVCDESMLCSVTANLSGCSIQMLL